MRWPDTLAEILTGGADCFGAREAVADPRESTTYSGLSGDVNRLARALARLGLRPNERSLVILPNSVDFVRAHFANLQAGLVSVPCDSAISGESLGAVVRSCQPRALLTDSRTAGRLDLPGLAVQGVAHVVVMGGGVVGNESLHDGTQLMAAEVADRFVLKRLRSDLAVLMYTTGTTGRAKGVMLTHENVLSALHSIVEFVGYTSDDREVVVLPLSHNFGLGHVYCNLLSGGAVYTENGLARPGRVLKALASFSATGFPSTPTGIGLLLDQYGPVLADKGRGLRFSVINSAPLPPERTEQLQRALPQLDIMVYYGLTEASRTAFISLSKKGPGHYGSVGCPMPHVELEIRVASGVAPVGATGEVVIRGPAVSRGYWNDPTQTDQAFVDGWLQTGDLGHLDAAGHLWITGRIKDLINSGGYKVIPMEVERVLVAQEGVVDAAVAGVTGLPGLTGESVVAGLVLAPGAGCDEAALQRRCLQVLEKFKVPVRFIPIESVPRTNTGKVRRAELAELLLARAVAGNSPDSQC